jgi:hypothetical protein
LEAAGSACGHTARWQQHRAAGWGLVACPVNELLLGFPGMSHQPGEHRLLPVARVAARKRERAREGASGGGRESRRERGERERERGRERVTQASEGRGKRARDRVIEREREKVG